MTNPSTTLLRPPTPVRGGSQAVAAPAGIKRVVYFIASHVNPDQVVRLVKACRSGHPQSRVVIHHDYKVSNLGPADVESLENVDLLKDHAPVDWGGFTQCVMLVRSLRWLVDNRDFDWVVYLSGQDYPICPLRRIERELSETLYDGFLDAAPVEDRSWGISGQRYYYRYYDLPKFKGSALLRGWIQRRGNALLANKKVPRLLVPVASPRTAGGKIGLRPLRSPFHEGFKCYAGSSWWSLNRKAVESILKFTADNESLASHYRRVLFAPNESYFLTILQNDPNLNLCTSDNKRLITWTNPETGHPDTLRADDFDRIVSSGMHFGRKVDQRVDARLLDLLDEHIGLGH